MASSAVSAANLALQSRNEAEEFKNTVVTDASQVANDKNTVSSDKNTAVSAMNTAVSAATESTNSKNTASNLLQSISDLHDTLLQIKTDVQNILANVNQDKIDIQSLKVAVDADVISSGANAASALSSKNAAGVSETNSANSATAAQNSYLAVLALLTAGLAKGTWNANTNTPTLANGTGIAGWWYIVSVAGTSLSQSFVEGDLIVYNGANWIRVPKSLALYLNDQWQTGLDFVGNVANLFKLTKDNTLLFGVPVELNSLFHVLNAGLNNIVDIPVNALSSAGTEHGVKIVVGGVEIGRFSALSDGSGGVYAALATIQNLLEGYQTTATAGGTTTLTGLSAHNQYFTGSANQTVLLPVVTTLKNGLSYWFTNSSTGTITVQSSGGNAIVVMAAGTTATFSCINIAGGTGTASWSYWYEGVTVASGKKLGVSNSLTLAGPDGTTQTFQASDTIVGRGTTDTLTNKRITARTPAVTQAAAPVINTDNTDQVHIIGLAQAITSMTTNLTGTPVAGDQLWFDITDNGTGRAIAWGAKFEASGTITLPTATVAGVRLDVGFAWNPVTSAWRIISKS